jgi:hypothetical protein
MMHVRTDLRPELDDCVAKSLCVNCVHAEAIQNLTGVPKWYCDVYQLSYRYVPTCDAFKAEEREH